MSDHADASPLTEDQARVVKGELQSALRRLKREGWHGTADRLAELLADNDRLRAALARHQDEHYAAMEEHIIEHAANHWFTQGGTSQFGGIGEPKNADSLIAEILRVVRALLTRHQDELKEIRLRAYRQARVFEPSMEGYGAAMAVFHAAFPDSDWIGGVEGLHVGFALDRVEDERVKQLEAQLQQTAQARDEWERFYYQVREQRDELLQQTEQLTGQLHATAQARDEALQALERIRKWLEPGPCGTHNCDGCLCEMQFAHDVAVTALGARQEEP